MNKFLKRKKWIFLISLLLVILISAYFIDAYYSAGEIMVTSISSDGNYAITTDLSRKAILWNLKNHTKKILDRKGNIYSAYFIKNSNNFMWQHDVNNEVIVENTDGKIIKKFNPGFPTYGAIMSSNLKFFIASDEDWNLYLIKNTENRFRLNKDSGGFVGVGKLLNLMFAENDNFFISSGRGDLCDADKACVPFKPRADAKNEQEALSWVILWDLNNKEALYDFPGNVAKTFATLSPDGKYLVSGDEATGMFQWQTNNGKLMYKIPYMLGYVKEDAKGNLYYDNKGFPIRPTDFKQYDGGSVYAIFSLKFIDNTHYLRFTTYVPNYAILYSVTDPKPLKYLSLERSPKISVDDYTRDQSIDTSPEAHILVTGKINHGGILVYQYDLKTQTLKKVWNGR